MIRIILFSFFVELLLVSNSYAQTTPETNNNIDGSAWKLPPLQLLIDSALMYSPLMRMADQEILLSQYALLDVRRDWMKKVNLTTDARYGSMFDYSRMSSLSGGSFIPFSANLYSLTVGAGMGVYMPISDVFDRKRLISSAKTKIEQAEIKKEDIERAVKQVIVSAYYEVLSLQKTLETHSKIQSSSDMLYEQTKSDFEENIINLAEYNKVYETYLNSQNTYETHKNNLLKAIRTLEINVGITLLK